MKEREPALLRELSKDKIPTRSFLWPTQIWLPTNWIIRRNFQGQSEVVPTVLSKQVTSITTPRSDPSQPVGKNYNFNALSLIRIVIFINIYI